MSHVMLQIFVDLFFIQAALINVFHCTKADVIKDCLNFTTCIESYADIYDALASDDNSFNIESALYPATKPSSVRVFVYVYGPTKKDNSTTDTKYTWSMNCLYAALPAGVLEILSLGSILVTYRTKELNITIPQFCCNVSVAKRQQMIKEVLAALQDLAVSPKVRDARLNSAECVTEGHKPDIEATGRSDHIRATLWCSFVSVLFLGPLLAFYILLVLKHDRSKDYCVWCKKADSTHNDLTSWACCLKSSCCYKKEKPWVLSLNYFCHFLVLMEFISVIYVLKNSGFSEFYMLLGMIFEGIAICFIQWVICVMQMCQPKCDFCDSSESTFYRRSVFVAGVNVVLYHLFWLTIGIMINPTWGLTVLLVVCLVVVALFYAVYMICDVDVCCSSLCIQRFSVSTAGFLGLCFAAAVPVLAGQSFYGRETADDILKTALLYVINFLILWMFQKAPASAPTPAPNSTTTTTTTTTTAPPRDLAPFPNYDESEEASPFLQPSQKS